MITELVAWFGVNRDCIEKFFNSNGFTAIAGAFAGAWAGAYIAQKIADKNKNKDVQLKEIHETNAAIMIAVTIFESAVAFKRQKVKPIAAKYEAAKAELLDYLRRRGAGSLQPGELFNFEIDFEALTLLPFPTASLEKKLFESLSIGSRALRVQIVLGQVTHSLGVFVEERNKIIVRFKNQVGLETLTPEYYFGLPLANGSVNKDYASCIEAMTHYTDDIIFFSHLLCIDLIAHCKKLSVKFKREFSRSPPRVVSVDFRLSEDMMPDAAKYQSWSSSFVERDPPQSPMRRLRDGLKSVVKRLAVWR